MGKGTHRFRIILDLSPAQPSYTNVDDGIYEEPMTLSPSRDVLRGRTSGGGSLTLDPPTGDGVLRGTFTQGPGGDGRESLVGEGKSYPLTLLRGESWSRPRGPGPSLYEYRSPVERGDGLAVGDLREEPRERRALSELVQEILDGKFPHLHGLLLVKGGRLVLEEYFYGYGPQDPHPVQSVTKSIFSLLVGVAVKKGQLALDEKLYDLFPDYRDGKNWDARKDAITLRSLLTMSSGLACDDWRDGDACSWAMVASGDWAHFVLGLPLAFAPHDHFAYCGACLSPLAAVLERSSGMPLPAFAQRSLFSPLGIEKPLWWEGPRGFHSPAFGLSLKPRDMAKIGEMVLRKGRWRGEQVVPEDWVVSSTAIQVAGPKGKRADYGYLWWERGIGAGGRTWRVLDAFGVGGQHIYVVPEKGIVLVLTGGNYKDPSANATCSRILGVVLEND